MENKKMYEGYSTEDLKWKIRQLKDRNWELEEKLRDAQSEIDHLQFRIKNELEPRIRQERNTYDRWVSSPERR